MKKRVNLWQVLPEEIISLIITSGLDLKSMVRCKLVCKQWRNLISTNYRPLPKGEIQFLCYDSNLHRFGALDDQSHQIVWMKTLDSPWRIRPHPAPDFDAAITSGNGLVCFISNRHEDVYICNPLIGECVPLPKMSSFSVNDYTFGFSPSSNEYKLIMWKYRSLEIYTLGDPTGWRRSPVERPALGGPAICVNGVLHWFIKPTQSTFTFDFSKEFFRSTIQSKSILTFDIAKEVFGSIPLPRLEAGKVIYQLGCLDHCLVVTAGYIPVKGMEIWVRKEDKSSGELVWTMDWVIDVAPPLVCLAVLKPRKLSTDGCIIMTCHYYSKVDRLYSYDPREKRVRPHHSPRQLHAFDYTPSLVSPKKLMQINGQRGSTIEKKGD